MGYPRGFITTKPKEKEKKKNKNSYFKTNLTQTRVSIKKLKQTMKLNRNGNWFLIN